MVDFFNAIWEWLDKGIFDFFTSATAYILTWVSVWWFESMIWQLEFAWTIGEKVITNLGLADHINSAMAQLPSEVFLSLQFFKFGQAVNLIGTSLVTRFCLTFMGWR